MMLLLLAASHAHAAACMCSRNVALPGVGITRPWAGAFAVDYGAKLEGDPDSWDGFYVKDRYGDSMAGMYMPPMLVHTASLAATVGLPAKFSVTATVPYMFKDNLGESEMKGDTDLASLNDLELTGHWVWQSPDMDQFIAVTAGPTLPTGTVVPNSAVRSGRGVIGGTVAVAAGTRFSPKVAIAVQLGGATGFGADSSGYVVAPNAALVAGIEYTTRENGRLSLALLGIERWSGTDHKDALEYKNSGYLVTDLAAAVSYTIWQEALRAVSLSVRAQAPVLQFVGDPMYAENFGASAGLSVLAF